MQEEHRPMDPTRRMLRVFGVTVTNYEERTAQLLEEAANNPPAAELLRLTAEAIEATASLNQQLREVNDHLLDRQSEVLRQMKAALDKAQPA